jgi:regulator of PEP synthase PpsR (kinase-PPPase family)
MITFNKIEAMDFTLKYDDAKDYSGIEKADVVIVGVSRTSKTPLCIYLASKGIKAINIPLMPEVEIPKEL